jgi:hypothetical protein
MAPRVNSELLLVGSLPANSTESALRAAAGFFGDLVFALPDGETGPRAAWVGYERERLVRPNPGVVVVQETESPTGIPRHRVTLHLGLRRRDVLRVRSSARYGRHRDHARARGRGPHRAQLRSGLSAGCEPAGEFLILGLAARALVADDLVLLSGPELERQQLAIAERLCDQRRCELLKAAEVADRADDLLLQVEEHLPDPGVPPHAVNAGAFLVFSVGSGQDVPSWVAPACPGLSLACAGRGTGG